MQLNHHNYRGLAMFKFKNDQAAGLRRLMATPKPRVVSVIAATPTQDQSHLMSNLAASILNQGYEVLVMHANPESKMTIEGIEKHPALLNVAYEQAPLLSAMMTSSHGYDAIQLARRNEMNMLLNHDVNENINHLFQQLTQQYEIVLVDAALNSEHLLPLEALNTGEILIQMTRHPASIKKAYTIIKQICSQLGRRAFGIIVDNATDAQAQIVFSNISEVARRYMQIELEYFGAIPNDDHLVKARKLGRTVIDAFPFATASSAFKQIAQRLDYHHDYDDEAQQASFI